MSATLHTNANLHTMGLPVVDFARIEQAAITVARTLKNVGLLAAAPFIGLAYAVALPFVGIALIAKTGYQAYQMQAK